MLCEPDGAAKPATIQRTTAKLLAGFFILILLFTLISRAADALTIPYVTTETSQYGSLTHKVSASGKVVSLGSQQIDCPAGLTVQEVLYKVGDNVKKGDTLLQVDPEALKQMRDKTANEIADMNAQIASMRQSMESQKDTSVSDARRALSDAEEDYDRTDEETSLAVSRAQEEQKKLQEEYDALKKAYDEQQSSSASIPPDTNNSPDGATDSGNQQTPKAASQPITEEQLKAAKQALENQKRAVEDARSARERQIETAERQVRNARQALATAQSNESFQHDSKQVNNNQTQVKIAALQLDLQKKQKELSDLSTLLSQNGAVKATSDGILTRCEATIGSATTNYGITISTGEQGARFEAKVPKEQAKLLQIGSKVVLSLTVDSKKQSVQGQITSIGAEDEEGLVPIVVSLPEGKTYRADEASTLDAQQESEKYPQCLPLSALRSDSNGDFIYVLREKESILGKELVAEKVKVTVRSRDEDKIAVDGAFQPDDKVIVSSSKPIEGGDRVREQVKV